MNFRNAFIVLLLTIPVLSMAQSKSELQASLTASTARGDSLMALNQSYMKLLDSLQVMTGVQVQNLDTVKNVLAARHAARNACMDSLAHKNTLLKGQLLHADSLNKEIVRLRADNVAMTDRLAAAAAGQSVPSSGNPSEQVMKLNGMLEQGLITKDEFLKLKAGIMK